MLPVAHDHIFDVFVARIDEGASDKLRSRNLRARLAKLQHVAALKHHDILRLNDTQRRCPISVPVELAVLTVNRHQELWPGSFNKNLQILLAAVSRYVNSRNAAVNHLRAALVTVRDQS